MTEPHGCYEPVSEPVSEVEALYDRRENLLKMALSCNDDSAKVESILKKVKEVSKQITTIEQSYEYS